MTHYFCQTCARILTEGQAVEVVCPERREPADLAHPVEYADPRCRCGSTNLTEHTFLVEAEAEQAEWFRTPSIAQLDGTVSAAHDAGERLKRQVQERRDGQG